MSATMVHGDAGVSTSERERAYYALNAKAYRLLSHVYEPTVRPLRHVRKQVTALSGVTSKSRVLDVATGTGAQARAFAEKAAEVVGIDLSDEMLQVARRLSRAPNLSFQRADATSLPFDDESFDVTSISMALHEMPASIRLRVLGELRRVTKPGGTVTLVDYGRPPGLRGDLVAGLVRLYERAPFLDFLASDLRELAHGAGLEVVMEVPLFHAIVRALICRPRSSNAPH